MGSAALRDAIQGIIDWGETVGGVGGGLPKATESFWSFMAWAAVIAPRMSSGWHAD